MKKLLLSLCLLGTMQTYPLSYNDLKALFKEELYLYQKGLMKRDKYFNFIEDYLEECERTMAIPQKCSKLPDVDIAIIYFIALVSFNIAAFHDHVSPTAQTKHRLEMHKKNVLTTIQQVKAALYLDNLDPNTELQKIVELFTGASKAYYQKLNFAQRALLKYHFS